MSWLSKATGININLLGAIKKTASGANLMPLITEAGTVIAEFDPAVIDQVEAAVNNLLVNAGVAGTEAEADALIEAEFAKIGIHKTVGGS